MAAKILVFISALISLSTCLKTGLFHARPKSWLSSTYENDLRKDILASTNGVSRGDDCSISDVRLVFDGMSTSDAFLSQIWQKQPFLYSLGDFKPLPIIERAFTMADLKEVIASEFVEAGRGSFEDGKTGWNMAAVSLPKGKTFQEAKLHYEDVLSALQQKNGTVVFNSAGGFIPKIAALCLETINSLNLPCAVNMYITNPGQLTSAPPHTDKQDVFVLQTEGRKRWRVYAPPPPKRRVHVDPYARGKGQDVLELTELLSPLIDTILVPGQVLYVPAGFPHTTDTLFQQAEVSDQVPSLHLTVGVDTLMWGLNYASLRSLSLKRAGLEDKLVPTKLDTQEYFSLHETLPFGFLTNPIVKEFRGSGPAMRQALYSTITQNLIRKMRAVESARWAALTDEEMAATMNFDESISRLIQHHNDITNAMGMLYEDVANKISPVQMDLSLFRSQPYYVRIEKTMSELIAWGEAAKAKETPVPSATGGSSKREKGRALREARKGKEGFGS